MDYGLGQLISDLGGGPAGILLAASIVMNVMLWRRLVASETGRIEDLNKNNEQYVEAIKLMADAANQVKQAMDYIKGRD